MSFYKGSGVPPKKDELGNALKEDREDKTNPNWRNPDNINRSLKEALDEKGEIPTNQTIPHKINAPGTTAGDSAPIASQSDYLPYIFAFLGTGVVGTALYWMKKGGKML